jgi:hypothetical protein
MMCEKLGKSWPKLRSISFNLDLFFVYTYEYVCTYYCTSLRYYITQTSTGALSSKNGKWVVALCILLVDRMQETDV